MKGRKEGATGFQSAFFSHISLSLPLSFVSFNDVILIDLWPELTFPSLLSFIREEVIGKETKSK